MKLFSSNHPKKCELYIHLLGISFDQSGLSLTCFGWSECSGSSSSQDGPGGQDGQGGQGGPGG